MSFCVSKYIPFKDCQNTQCALKKNPVSTMFFYVCEFVFLLLLLLLMMMMITIIESIIVRSKFVCDISITITV